MNIIGVRDLKANLSAGVEAAERGEATTITKHGHPAAVVVPVEIAREIVSGGERPSFASLLMSISAGNFEPDQTPATDPFDTLPH